MATARVTLTCAGSLTLRRHTLEDRRFVRIRTGKTEDDPIDAEVDEAAPAAPAPAPRSPGVAVLTRLVVVLAVLAVAGGGVWLVTRASTPEASPTTTEIPALQVKAADVRPGSVAPAGGAVAGGADQQTSPQQARPRSTGPST